MFERDGRKKRKLSGGVEKKVAVVLRKGKGYMVIMVE